MYMQVKRRPYLYSSVHLPLRWKGSKQSIPTWVKGAECSTLTAGSWPICCIPKLPLSRLQVTHLPVTDLTRRVPPPTQNPACWTLVNVWALPESWGRWWAFLTMSSARWLFFGMISGKCSLNPSRVDLLTLPPTRSTPSWVGYGFRQDLLFFLLISPSFNKVLFSSLYTCFCAV